MNAFQPQPTPTTFGATRLMHYPTRARNGLPLAVCILFATINLALMPQRAHARDEYLLISSRENIRVDSWSKKGKGWSVKKTTLHGGKQEGVDLITVDNGKLQLDLIPTRGMSIYQVRCGDVRLGWDSPVEEIVHPSLIDLESRGGLGWLEGFNEWMVRCGLEFAGHPGTDEFVNNTGDTATMDLTLHGKIGNIPASEVSVIIEQTPEPRIRIRGEVYEKFFYGPKLKLVTEISFAPGEAGFQIEDQITNLGSDRQEFQIIYHANFGAPLLESNAKVHAAAKQIMPMNEHAAAGIADYATYAAPTRGFVEQVYLVEPLANDQGQAIAVLQNATGDRAVSMSWPVKQLPYLTIWKNTASAEEGYVTGIEPATGYPFNRKIEREAGRVPQLDAGQTRSFRLDVKVLSDREAVESAIREVERVQKAQPAKLIAKPPAS